MTEPAVKGAAGTHVVLPGYYAPKDMGLLDINTSDGRFLFFLPWLGHTIVGTTDRAGAWLGAFVFRLSRLYKKLCLYELSLSHPSRLHPLISALSYPPSHIPLISTLSSPPSPSP